MPIFCTVKRAVAAFVVDGPDEDRDPDRVTVQGMVTFTPVLAAGDAVTMVEDGEPVTVLPRPIEARISDGVILHRGQEGIRLLAGGDEMNPPKLVWKASFSNMQAAGWSFTLHPVRFEAVPGGEVDLTVAAPVANVPEGVVRGPAGTSLHDIVPDGGELVVTVSDDSGVRELRRIPLDDVVRAEADAAAEAAASGVREAVESDRKAAEDARDDAQGAARTAAEEAVGEVGEEFRSQVADDADRAVTARTGAESARTDAEAARDDARGEVTRQIQDVVDGAPEDLDTLRELAEYATENRDMLDQVNEAIANKANRGHRHEASEIDGLDEALGNVVRDDDDRLSDPRTPTAHEHSGDEVTVTVTVGTDDGDVSVDATVQDAVQGLTDDMAQSMPQSRIQVVDEVPDSPTTGTIYLVRE